MIAILNPNNRLFMLARQGQGLPSGVVAGAVALGLLVVMVVGQAAARILVRSTFESESQGIASPIVENVIGFLPFYLAIWMWLRVSSKRTFRSLGLETGDALRHLLGGARTALVMIGVVAAVAIASGAEPVPSQTPRLAALGIALASLVGYLIQGTAEEILFRGWLLPVLGARYNPALGLFVSAMFFSLAHGGNPPLAMLNLFLFGVFAACYALSEGGLWGIGAWHAVWNWAMGDVLGFAVSGSAHSGLLISIRATGPDLVTGGAFGLEGGLGATCVFLIGIGAIVTRSRSVPDSHHPR